MKKYFDNYLESRIKNSLDTTSFKLYEHNLNSFYNYIENKKLQLLSIKEDDIIQYVNFLVENKMSNSTINQHISTLRGFFDFLEQTTNSKNPTVNISNLEIVRNKDRLADEEIDKIIGFLENENTMDVRDRLILLLIIQHGFRGANLCELDKKNVIYQNTKIEIVTDKQKISIDSKNTLVLYRKYLEERKLIKNDNSVFFTTKKGEPLKKPHIIHMAKRMAKFAGISNSSLSFLARTKKDSPGKELIDNRYQTEKIIRKKGDYQIIKAIDRKDNNTYKLIKLSRLNGRDAESNQIKQGQIKQGQIKQGQIKQEYKFLSEFNHVNIVRILDIGAFTNNSQEQMTYIVIEYLEGVTLESIAGKIDINDFLDISLGLLSGLSYLHGQGILHRDIKPENILLIKKDSKFIPKYVDIGLACRVNEQIENIKGSPQFMPPELFKLKISDRRSDIYSLGITLFYLLTKQFPYKSKQHDFTNQEPVDLKSVDKNIPELLIKIINKMIEPNIEHRYSDAESCANHLKSLYKQKPTSNLDELPKFTIKLDKEAEIIAKNVLAIVESRNFPLVLSIVGEQNSGKSYLIDEAKKVATLNSISVYTLNLKKNSSAKSLAEIFLGNEKGEVYYGNSSQDFKMDKVSLFAQTLNTMKKKTPILLSIDNFDLGSKEFYEFFLFVLKKQVRIRERILIVIACNPTHKSYQDVLGQINEIVSNTNDLIKIELLPLSKDKIESYLVDWFGKSVQNEVIDYIFATSQGRMTKTTDLLNFLITNKYFKCDPSSTTISFSDSFYNFNSRDISREIDYDSSLILSIIATSGKPIEYTLLMKVTNKLLLNKTSDDLRSSITALIEKKILYQVTENTIFFENKYFSTLFYHHIPKDRVQEIHNLLGLELEKNISLQDNEDEDAIIEHFYSAKNLAKSLFYLKNKALKAKEYGLLRDSLESFNRLMVFYDEFVKKDKLELLIERIKILVELTELKEARREHRRADELAEDQEDRLTLKYLDARILVKEGKIKESLAVCDSALTLVKEPRLSPIHLNILILKASSLISISNYSQAIDFLIPIIDVKIDEKLSAQSMTLKNLLGLSYFYLGEFSLGEKTFKSVLVEAEKYHNTKIYLTALHNLGTLYYHLCDFDNGLKLCERAKEVADIHFDILSKAMILINMASINQRVGNMKKAIDLYDEAEEIYHSLGEIRNFENLLLGFGLVYANIGIWEKAKSYQERAEEYSKNRTNNLILGYSYALKGDIERGEKNYELAMEFYNKAIEIFKKFSLTKELCQLYLYSAETLLIMGRIDTAYDSIQNAKSIKNICQFPDTLLRITLQEILWELSKEPIRYSEINTKLNTIKENPILKSDWELHLKYLKVLADYQKLIGQEDESSESLTKLKNRMKEMIDGFPTDVKNNFLVRSEFGIFIKECDAKNVKSDIERLLEINLEISENLDLSIVLDKILNNILIISNADIVYIVLKSDRGRFLCKAIIDKDGNKLDKTRHSFSKTILKNVIEKKKTIVINDIENVLDSNKSESITNLKIQSIIAIPLLIRREVMGVLYVENREKKSVLNTKDLKLFYLFASQAAIAIENANHFNQVVNKNESLISKTQDYEKELEKKSVYIDSHERKIKFSYDEMIGQSDKLISVFNLLDKIVESDITVLITGESGTGKELIARAIHKNSKRSNKPFITENCAVFSEQILEGELFGHKKGAFTDAVTDRSGIFEIADGGTVFLDEVGDMSYEMQKKLLRFLQSGEFRRVGEDQMRKVDVRILSATNRNLKKMVGDGTFREDLYYRLNVMSIPLPPLRERKEDIPSLINYFINRYNISKNENVTIEDEVIESLKKYYWPGNIRELENEIMRLIVLRDSSKIDKRLIADDPRFM